MEQILEEIVRNILTEFETDDRALISTSGAEQALLNFNWNHFLINIYISCEISIEHPSVGLASLAQ